MRTIEGPPFAHVWKRRIKGRYGRANVNWMDLDSLIDVKSRISDPRHRRDVRDLERVRALRARESGRKASARAGARTRKRPGP